MIILPFIPILALLVQTVYMLNGILESRHEIIEIETQVGGVEILNFRFMDIYILSINQSKNDPFLQFFVVKFQIYSYLQI